MRGTRTQVGRGTFTWARLEIETRFGGGFRPFLGIKFPSFFKERCFFMQVLLHREGLHTEMVLRREMILQRDVSTCRCSCQEILSTQRCFCTRVL